MKLTPRRAQFFAILVPLLCLPLLAGCGWFGDEAEIKALYKDFSEAVQQEDVEALGDMVAAEAKDGLSGPEAKQMLQMVKQMKPPAPDIRTITVSGDKATLEAEAVVQGQKMTGTVEFVREKDGWKVLKENWSISLELDAAGPVQPFLEDPKNPPRAQLVLKGHQAEISRLAWSRDGRFLISVSYGDYSLRVWDAAGGEQVAGAKTAQRVRDMALSADGRTIYTADAYNNLTAWPFGDGTLGEPRVLTDKAGDALAVSPDGSLIATTAFRAPVRVWSAADGKLFKELAGTESQRVLAFSPSGKLLASAGDGNTYTLWNTANWTGKRCVVNRVSKQGIWRLAVSRDEKLLVTGHTDSSIVIFDLAKRKELHNFFIRNSTPRDVTFSADGKLLAAAAGNAVNLYDTKTAKLLVPLKAHKQAVVSLAFSPDGSALASGGEDRQIVIWRSGPGASGATAADTKPAGSQPAQPGRGPVLEIAGHKSILLGNPSANEGTRFWKTQGEVAVEGDAKGNPHFVLRYKGHFFQDVRLPQDATGRFALLIARAASERVESDGDQTGRPYLYGYWVNSNDPNRFNGYLNGGELMLKGTGANEWGVAWGVFQVPEQTASIRFFMQQADGHKAQNGSAARFDDVAVYLFDNEAQANGFVERYRREAAALSTGLPTTPGLTGEPAPAPAPAASESAPPPPPKPRRQRRTTEKADSGGLVGKRLSEVERRLGSPRMRVRQGRKEIWTYDERVLIADDGVTVTSDLPRQSE